MLHTRMRAAASMWLSDSDDDLGGAGGVHGDVGDRRPSSPLLVVSPVPSANAAALLQNRDARSHASPATRSNTAATSFATLVNRQLVHVACSTGAEMKSFERYNVSGPELPLT